MVKELFFLFLETDQTFIFIGVRALSKASREESPLWLPSTPEWSTVAAKAVAHYLGAISSILPTNN
jgi:hypothetical protein